MPHERGGRRGMNRPGSQRSGAGRCAGIRNPQARDECMRRARDVDMNQNSLAQQSQQAQRDTGGPAPPGGPGGPRRRPRRGISRGRY